MLFKNILTPLMSVPANLGPLQDVVSTLSLGESNENPLGSVVNILSLPEGGVDDGLPGLVTQVATGITEASGVVSEGVGNGTGVIGEAIGQVAGGIATGLLPNDGDLDLAALSTLTDLLGADGGLDLAALSTLTDLLAADGGLDLAALSALTNLLPVIDGLGALVDGFDAVTNGASPVTDGLSAASGNLDGITGGLSSLTGGTIPDVNISNAIGALGNVTETSIFDTLAEIGIPGVNNLDGTLTLVTLLIGSIAGQLINETGLDDELGRLANILEPVDDLISDIELGSVTDAFGVVVENVAPIASDALDTVVSMSPAVVGDTIEDIPALGLIGGGALSIQFGPFTIPLGENGGVLDDTSRLILKVLGLDGAAGIVDDLNDALQPLNETSQLGDILGGDDFLFGDTVQGGADNGNRGLGTFFDGVSFSPEDTNGDVPFEGLLTGDDQIILLNSILNGDLSLVEGLAGLTPAAGLLSFLPIFDTLDQIPLEGLTTDLLNGIAGLQDGIDFSSVDLTEVESATTNLLGTIVGDFTGF